MEYNTSQKKLVLPEYGRHVHMMVQQAIALKDREQRNAAARSIVGVMSILQPQLRDQPDYKHKLWDHLFIMSDFKLDIDSPYQMPASAGLVERPQTVPYTQGHIRQRHYGKILIEMIREAARETDPEAQLALVQMLANQMKKTYMAWNRVEITPEQIAQDIWDISDGKITLEPGSIQYFETPEPVRQNQGQNQHQKSKKKRFMSVRK